MPSLLQATALDQSVDPGRDRGELPNRFFHADHLLFSHPIAQHLGREREGVDHVEMCTGIRCTDDAAIVLPELATKLPGLGIVSKRGRHEVRLQIVRNRDLDHGVEGRLAEFLRDISDRAASVFLGLGRESLVDDQVRPVGQETEDSRFLGLGVGVHFCAPGRVAQHFDSLGHAQPKKYIPAVQRIEHEAGLQIDPHGHRLGHRECQHLCTPLPGEVRRGQLGLGHFGTIGRRGEYVPVERALGRERQVRHQLHLFFAEFTHPRQELEHSSRVVTHDSGQGDQLFSAGVTRGDRLPFRVVVRRRDRRREAHSAAGEGLAQQLFHCSEVVGAGLLSDRSFAHHHATQGRMTDHETRVDRKFVVEFCQVLLERTPIPGDSVLKGLERHAFDSRQHSHQVVAGFGR